MIWLAYWCGVLVCVTLMRRTSEINDEIYYRRAMFWRKVLSPAYQRRLDAETEALLSGLDERLRRWKAEEAEEQQAYNEALRTIVAQRSVAGREN